MYIDHTQSKLHTLRRDRFKTRNAQGTVENAYAANDDKHKGADVSDEERKYNSIMNTAYGKDGKIADSNDNTPHHLLDITG